MTGSSAMTGSTTINKPNPRRPINRQCSDMSEASAVSFGAVQVREFDRIPGDHPDCKMGVPLTIGWAYYEQDPICVNEYEEIKATKQEPGEDGTFVTKLGSQDRMSLLKDFNVPLRDILAAQHETQTFIREKERRKIQDAAEDAEVVATSASATTSASAASGGPPKKPLKALRKNVKKVMSIFQLRKQQQQSVASAA